MGKTVEITAKPGSGRSEISMEGGKLVAYLKSKPEGGKANAELEKLAAKHFGAPARIIRGKSSRKKTLLIG